jgi:hypothetical protein
MQLSNFGVDKPSGGKKAPFVGGTVDQGNIVPGRRRQGPQASISKHPRGKIASASSGSKRRSELAGRSPAAAVKKLGVRWEVTENQKPSHVGRPIHTTKFLGETYTLPQLSKGLGLPPFKSSTKAELEALLLSQSHAATQGESFDPTLVIEGLEEAFDAHLAFSERELQSPGPLSASSQTPEAFNCRSSFPSFIPPAFNH